jgi:hypothetical protein
MRALSICAAIRNDFVSTIFMIESPIALTPEQRQQIYNDRAKRFMDGMQKLTEETGLVIIPGLQETEHGAMIILRVVDKPVQPDISDNYGKKESS